MLVLARKRGEKIVIGTDIVVSVVHIGSNVIRLGIQAPKGTTIYREEIAARIGMLAAKATEGTDREDS